MEYNTFSFLACPECEGNLTEKNKSLFCRKCKKTYPIRNNKPFFIDKPAENEESATESINQDLDKGGAFAKIKRAIPHFLAPPDPSYHDRKAERKVMESITNGKKNILNIGSSSTKAYKNSINLDIGDFENVDIVADGKKLPFKSGSFDTVLIEMVLEHVDEPEKIITEAYRVLKKNGKIFISIPFVFVFHGSPNDFNRYTLNGLCKRLENNGFSIEKKGILSGPGSTLSQMSRYYLASLFSFNNRYLYSILLNVFGWLTFWLKYTDIFLTKLKKAHLMSASIYAIGKK